MSVKLCGSGRWFIADKNLFTAFCLLLVRIFYFIFIKNIAGGCKTYRRLIEHTLYFDLNTIFPTFYSQKKKKKIQIICARIEAHLKNHH